MTEAVPLSERLPVFENAIAVHKLLTVNYLAAEEWLQDELGGLLSHQLAAPLASDVGAMEAAKGLGVQQLSERLSRPGVTFGDVLGETRVDADLLAVVKWFAKKQLVTAEPALPKPIALYLYNLAIVNAERYCHQKISQTPDRDIVVSMVWLLQQTWLTGLPREQLESALTWLSTRPPRP